MFVRHLLDSEAARKAIAKGLSIALRYLRKAARISLASLHDMSTSITVERVESAENKSDILTKPMDQQTLTKHLYSLGYFTLEWLSAEPAKNNTKTGTSVAAVGTFLARCVSESL